MEVGFVAGGSRGLYRVIPVVLSEFLELIEDLLSYGVALLDPAFRPASSTHFHKPAFAVQNFDSFPVLSQADFVVDRSDAIAQGDLWRRDVDDLEHVAPAAARG